MKWIAKALVQKSLSAFPHGERLNYWLQKKTGGLPVSPGEFIEKVRLAHTRVKRWEQFGSQKPLKEILCFEFGAGWDLIGPLAYWSFGIDHQIVIDIRPNLRPELLQDSVRKFLLWREQCEVVTGRTLRPMPSSLLEHPEKVLTAFGIHYLAPLDAATTKLPDSSIDFISTNSTLEHIPAESLARILGESKRILRDDGIACHLIDMKDHFSYFDQSITKYNFLTYPDSIWGLVNSSIAYQNRLRYSDYHRLFKDAGLQLIDEEIEWAPEEDLRAFRHLKLTRRFAGTDSDEHLAAHILRVVLKK
jgi:SAM-dependent methyltransferase